MAHVKADRVQETTTSTGTGALTLAGATAKRLAFSAALADTDTCVCLIEHASAAEWEISLCTFASGAGALTRSTIYGSTNGGSAVSFSAGTKYISLIPTASKMIVADNGGTVTIPGALLPAANDGGALGSATLSFSDGFFASGAVLNFNNANYTITHSSGILSFSGVIQPSSNDGAALGAAATSWSDLFLASGAVINFGNGNVTITHSAGAVTFSGIVSIGSTVFLSNGANMSLGTSTGSKIGTTTSQKLGFWNATPVVQQARPTDAASIITLLTTLGLCA